MGAVLCCPPWSKSDAVGTDSVDASELLPPVEQEDCDFDEAVTEKVLRSRSCHSLKRCCLCISFSGGALALSLGVLWRFLTYTPPIPGMEGDIPDDPFFVKHLGGFCFGRHRVEQDPMVGSISIDFFKDSGLPWAGNGELYVLAFDDEPNHWEAAASDWNVSAWNHMIQDANGCREVLYLETINGTQAVLHAVQRVTFNLRENFPRRWNLVLLGLNLQLDPILAGKAHYRITAEKARLQWDGSKLLRHIPRTCPADYAEWSKEVWHDYVVAPSPRQAPLQPMSWIMAPETKLAPTAPPEEDARKNCHGVLSR